MACNRGTTKQVMVAYCKKNATLFNFQELVVKHGSSENKIACLWHSDLGRKKQDSC